MPRQARSLTAVQVAKAKLGTHFDGGGLMLIVGEASASWMLRYTYQGRRREIGLGSARGKGAVGLAQARVKADELRAQVRAGQDPLVMREAAKSVREAAAANTFEVVAQRCFDAKQAGWSNGRHQEEWMKSLRRYVMNELGKRPVDAITADDIEKVLSPIWTRIPETASRVRQRLEMVFNYATALKLRTEGKANPALWRGNLSERLASPKALQRLKQEAASRGEHYPSLPWRQVPSFMRALDETAGMAALALKFAILTAARSGEARGMRWREVDEAQRLWNVPGPRMKRRKPHTVPLSDAAMVVLCQVRPLASNVGGQVDREAYVFPGARSGKYLSDMALSMLTRGMARDGLAEDEEPRWVDPSGQVIVPHGFRTSFKEWSRAHTWPDELSELALSHQDPNAVRAAYARDPLVEERRPLMQAWGEWCVQH